MKVEIRKEVIEKLNKMIEECNALNIRIDEHRNKRDAVYTTLDYKKVENAHNEYMEALDAAMKLVERFFIVKDKEIQRLTGIFDKMCSDFSENLKTICKTNIQDLMDEYKEFEKEQSEVQEVIKELQSYKLPIKPNK